MANDDWEFLEPDSAGAIVLVRELEREMPGGHLLRETRLEAVARSYVSDDVIYRVMDVPGGRYAAVHLTWRPERDPRWPAATLHPSLQEALAVVEFETEFR